MNSNPDPNDENPPSTGASTVNIYPILRRSFFGLKDPLQGLAFGGCAVVASFFMPDSQSTWILLGGLLFLLLGTPWFYLEFYRFATFGPHLVLTEKGIWDRRGNFGLVEWDEIQSISIDSEFIKIQSSKIYTASRLTKALSKIEAVCDYEGEFIFYAMRVPFKTLSIDPAKIWPYIVKQCQNRGLKCSYQSCIANEHG